MSGNSFVLRLAFTLILLAYFLVWLPRPVVGLSFIGLELGEWVKFLPAVSSGAVGIDRNLFYMPPLLLGLIMVIWTAGWPDNLRTMVARFAAVLVAAVALPSVDAIRFESADQWLLRLGAVMLVAALALILKWWPRTNRQRLRRARGAAWLVLGLMGALLPTWAYLVVRPEVATLLAAPVGTGVGVWLNALGFLLTAVIGLSHLLGWRDPQSDRERAD